MSLQPQTIPPVPEATVGVARAAFPKGNLYIRMRDELGTLYDDTTFSDLYPKRGQPAEPPWRLALITVMQYVENFVTVRLLKLCGLGSTGSMRSRWS